MQAFGSDEAPLAVLWVPLFLNRPGEARSQRRLQASASRYFDALRQHDPGNGLLRQAEDELLAAELDVDTLAHTLDRLAALPLDLQRPVRTSPPTFPLRVEVQRERVTTESPAQRLTGMLAELEAAACGGAAPPDVGERRTFGQKGDKAAMPPQERRDRRRRR